MTSFTRNILDFYENNTQNDWYLEKYFTNTNNLGIYRPYADNPVCSKPDGSPFIGTVDEHNTYKINSFGLRGEIYENADVLASGCSITFGLGVPEEARWTNLLGNMINKNVMNLGNPGASAETICNSIIQYCMNNKMPKQIFCLMPDFFRNIVIVDKEFYKSEVKRKGSQYTVQALELLKQSYPQLQATLFGVYPRPKQLPTWIQYHQRPADLAKIYNDHAVFISASLGEGWALPPAEAMACGCAVVCTDIGGHADYAINEQTALLVPPENAIALANAVQRLFEQAALRIALSAQAEQFIKTHFNWERSVEALLQYYAACQKQYL